MFLRRVFGSISEPKLLRHNRPLHLVVTPETNLCVYCSIINLSLPHKSLVIPNLWMNTFFLSEVCGKCGEALSRSQSAVRAMDKLFHSHCFCCVTCQRPLQSMQFYDRDGTPQCEDCYMVRHVKWHICGLHFLESEKQSCTWHTSLMWELVLFSDIVHILFIKA